MASIVLIKKEDYKITVCNNCKVKCSSSKHLCLNFAMHRGNLCFVCDILDLETLVIKLKRDKVMRGILVKTLNRYLFIENCEEVDITLARFSSHMLFCELMKLNNDVSSILLNYLGTVDKIDLLYGYVRSWGTIYPLVYEIKEVYNKTSRVFPESETQIN